MSNDRHKQTGNHRIIGLKPITFPELDQDPTHQEQIDQQEKLDQINQELANAERALTDTQQAIKEQQELARQEIENDKIAWEQEKEALAEQAKQLGYQKGFDEGSEAGLQAYHDKLLQADQVIEAAIEERATLIDQSEPAILHLAVKIASKIVAKQLKESDAFVDMVKQAIQEVHEQPFIKIHTSPEDFELVQRNQDQLMTLLDPEVVLSIHPSINLKQGDGLIETPYSRLDISVDVQLEKINRELLEVMEEINREHR
ncbi:flagellar assembly protein FliH [Amphibacillus sediminis]|uniref:flagellar assembly protein FliH n=1 Tax=Amphibacillus sediminis TaxID=360185 RepID=UPI000830BDF2|nr:flagellar assembly protein FliH [Amphibacillus sediminis]